MSSWSPTRSYIELHGQLNIKKNSTSLVFNTEILLDVIKEGGHEQMWQK